jgi:hypothetical protein
MEILVNISSSAPASTRVEWRRAARLGGVVHRSRLGRQDHAELRYPGTTLGHGTPGTIGGDALATETWYIG